MISYALLVSVLKTIDFIPTIYIGVGIRYVFVLKSLTIK
jgi:hypothetical protein